MYIYMNNRVRNPRGIGKTSVVRDGQGYTTQNLVTKNLYVTILRV